MRLGVRSPANSGAGHERAPRVPARQDRVTLPNALEIQPVASRSARFGLETRAQKCPTFRFERVSLPKQAT